MARLFEEQPGGGLGLAKDTSPLAKIGLTLQAFGAGGLGQDPLIMKLKEQELKERKIKRDQLESDFKITSEISKTAAEMPEAQRNRYIEKVMAQYPDLDKDLVSTASERPDLIDIVPAFAQNDPNLKFLVDKGDRKGAVEYIKSESGRKGWNQAALTTFAPAFQKKLPGMMQWHQQNNREEYQKIIEDGEITIPELRKLHDKLPLNLQATPQEFSTVMAPENQGVLVNMFGDEVRVIPDKVAEERLKPSKGSPVVNVKMPDDTIRSFRQDSPELDRAIQAGGVISSKEGAFNFQIITEPVSGDLTLVDKKKAKQVATIAKGNKQEIKLENDIKAFEKELRATKIVESDIVLREAEDYLKQNGFIDEEGNVIKDLPGFGAGGMKPTGTLGKQGRDLRRIASKLKNITIKDRSGATVTPPEFSRLMEEFSQGSIIQYDQDFIDALKSVRHLINGIKETVEAAHPDDAVNAYKARFGKETKAKVGDVINVKGRRFRITALDPSGGNDHEVEIVQ